MVAIIQGPVAKGSQAVAYPSTAGETITNRYEMSVAIAPTPGAPIANDILEIGSLPPNCRVVNAWLDTDILTGITAADVGIMSGTPGSTDPARTCGNEFFAAQTLVAAGVFPMTKQAGFRVSASPAERSIGLKINAASSVVGKVALVVQLATG